MVMDMENMVTAMATVTAMGRKTKRKMPATPVPTATLLPKPPGLKKAAKSTIDLLDSCFGINWSAWGDRLLNKLN